MSLAILFLRLFAILAIARLFGFVVLRRALPTLPATAYALAGTFGLILATLSTWLWTHAGLRLSPYSCAGGLLAVAAAALFCATYQKQSPDANDSSRSTLRDVAIYHQCFVAAFAFALLVTMRNPSVDPDSERFMDLAMVNAVLSARELPLQDPWLAGERVSYYDYGYFATAWLSLLSGPIDTVFPIAVALVWATLLSTVVALGRDLAGYRGGVLCGLLVAIGGNLEGARQTVAQLGTLPWSSGISDFDWFNGARVIKGTITEFPFFALLWGDLHPYVLALPIWPMLLAVVVTISAGAMNGATAVVGAVTFATLSATHTWDAFPALALLGLVALRPGPDRSQRLRSAATCVGLGCVLAAPYLVAAPVAGRGLRWVEQRSELTALGVAWGVQALLLVFVFADRLRSGSMNRHAPLLVLLACGLLFAWPEPGIALALLLSGSALALAFRPLHAGDADDRVLWMMVAVGSGLIFGVELLYLDDHYDGDLARMNTVFKAYVVAWVLMSMGSALLIARTMVAAQLGARSWSRALSLTVVAAVVLALIYPVRATAARSGNLLRPLGMDTRIALRLLYPDDALVIEMLRTQPRGVILEAVGGPYSWHSRFSSFTGFPTILGWGNHEAGWRNDWDVVQKRTHDILTAYRARTVAEMRPILDRYHVRYIVVGALERSAFTPEQLAKFDTLTPRLQSGTTAVYQIEQPGDKP